MKYPEDFINKVICGDCIEVMKAMKPNSVHAICTDPPYGLEFMGQEWDKLWDKRDGYKTPLGIQKTGDPFIGKNLSTYKAGLQAQLWHTRWLTEAYRVLKPGGSMLVMGGTRTSHRLACAIEDSGFIIKDTLMWIYGSGFPKAQDLGKMIDKRIGKVREVISRNPNSRERCTKNNTLYESGTVGKTDYISNPATDLAKHWDGFKVGGIKPAYEPIIWAVKPPEGSYVDNVLKWGVGAVNVDECRVGYQGNNDKQVMINKLHKKDTDNRLFGFGTGQMEINRKGRFPANIILSHHPECVQVGVKRVKGNNQQTEGKRRGNSMFGQIPNGKHYADPNGYEKVESWRCHPDCAVKMLDEQSGACKTGSRNGKGSKTAFFGSGGKDTNNKWLGDNGGASRFFYCAKASRAERNAGLEGMENGERPFEQRLLAQCAVCGNKGLKVGAGKQLTCGHNKIKYVKTEYKHSANRHPTVKPIRLFEWLIKLVTREGQIVLDPFIGSGTTAIAAHNAGRKCIGIEKEEEYIEIAKARIKYWKKQGRQLRLL